MIRIAKEKQKEMNRIAKEKQKEEEKIAKEKQELKILEEQIAAEKYNFKFLLVLTFHLSIPIFYSAKCYLSHFFPKKCPIFIHHRSGPSQT